MTIYIRIRSRSVRIDLAHLATVHAEFNYGGNIYGCQAHTQMTDSTTRSVHGSPFQQAGWTYMDPPEFPKTDKEDLGASILYLLLLRSHSIVDHHHAIAYMLFYSGD